MPDRAVCSPSPRLLHFPISDQLKALASDGCFPPALPPTEAWPAIRQAVVAQLRHVFGFDTSTAGLDGLVEAFPGVVAAEQERGLVPERAEWRAERVEQLGRHGSVDRLAVVVDGQHAVVAADAVVDPERDLVGRGDEVELAVVAVLARPCTDGTRSP